MNPLSKFSNEEIVILKSGFDSLQSIEDKLNFWSKNLRFNYSRIGYDCATNDVKDFWIKAETVDEKIELNLLLIKECIFLDSLFNKKPTILDFEKLTNELENKLKDVVNPNMIFRQELDWIERKYEENQPKVFTEGDYVNYLLSNEPKSFWNGGFNDYYDKRKEIDLNRLMGSRNLLAYYNGFITAQYKVYIENKQSTWQYKSKPEFEETSMKRQVLLLNYIGFLNSFNPNQSQHRDKFLALLLNRGTTNIRQILNDLNKKGNKVKTKENLQFVYDLLFEIGFEEEAQLVKYDIDKLK